MPPGSGGDAARAPDATRPLEVHARPAPLETALDPAAPEDVVHEQVQPRRLAPPVEASPHEQASAADAEAEPPDARSHAQGADDPLAERGESCVPGTETA